MRFQSSIAEPNLARRTGTYDVITAWKALLEAEDPKQIMNNKRLAEARQEINEEVERQTHTPPKFSKNGKIAVLKIKSQAQVHPVIATRWVCIYSFQYPWKLQLKSTNRQAISNPKP